MLLNIFSEGLNTRLSPTLMPPTTAQEFTNIDNASMSIKPLNEASLYQVSVDKFYSYYRHLNTIVSFAAETSFTEYGKKLYYTVPNSIPQMYDGISTVNLGIKNDSGALVAENIQPYSDGTAGDLPYGEYKYILVAFSQIGVAFSGYKYIRYYTVNLTNYNSITFDLTSLNISAGFLFREYEGIYRVVASFNTSTTIVSDTTLDISAGSTIAITSGYVTDSQIATLGKYTYNYVYTYYNSLTGYESIPTPISNNVNLLYSPGEWNGVDSLGDEIVLSGFVKSLDLQVDRIRIYRIGGDLTNYTLVTSILESSIADYATFTYSDYRKDIEIAANDIITSYTSYQAPLGLKYITEAYAMLFGAVESKLYFSEQAYVHRWGLTNYIQFNEDITGIAVVPNGILVFSEFTTYLVTGNSPATLSKFILSKQVGCVSHYTIGYYKSSAIWLSLDGLFISSGGVIEPVAKDKLANILPSTYTASDLSAVVHDSIYYLQLVDNILMLDFRFGLSIVNVTEIGNSIRAFNNTVYIHKSTDNSLYKLFGSTEPRKLTYKSPKLTEGLFSSIKYYKHIYISYVGNFTAKVYIDGRLMNEVELRDAIVQDILVKSASSGYSFEIELYGTGELYEIEFKALERQNGR